jgi:hypothetical protein
VVGFTAERGSPEYRGRCSSEARAPSAAFRPPTGGRERRERAELTAPGYVPLRASVRRHRSGLNPACFGRSDRSALHQVEKSRLPASRAGPTDVQSPVRTGGAGGGNGARGQHSASTIEWARTWFDSLPGGASAARRRNELTPVDLPRASLRGWTFPARARHPGHPRLD